MESEEGTVAEVEATMDELAALTETAGAEVVEMIYQKRDKPDSGTFIGSGKVKELRDIVEATGLLKHDRCMSLIEPLLPLAMLRGIKRTRGKALSNSKNRSCPLETPDGCGRPRKCKSTLRHRVDTASGPKRLPSSCARVSVAYAAWLQDWS